jgi:hypothetical protein
LEEALASKEQALGMASHTERDVRQAAHQAELASMQVRHKCNTL